MTKPATDNPTLQLTLDTYVKLIRSVNALSNRLIEKQTFGDLTHSQFGVLEAIFHLGPLSQTEISAKLLKSGGNISLVVDNLEKRQLVTRRRSSTDRRLVIVSLTSAGQELINEIFPLHALAIQSELDILTPSEQEQLGYLSRKLGKGGIGHED